MKKLLIFLVKVYQKYISRFTVRRCRFYPTCSEYCIQALDKYGLLKGLFLSTKRVLRCNPFNPGGYDPLK